MNFILSLTLLNLALSTMLTSAAPLPSLARVELSLPESIRSFESAYSAMSDQVEKAAAKRKGFGFREKMVTGITVGLSTLGTGGYIVSSAIPMSIAHRQKYGGRRLEEAVERANAQAALRKNGIGGDSKRLNKRRAGSERKLAKRSGVSSMEKALQEGMDHEADNESFYSALSRSNSQRRDEVEGRLLHNSDQSESIVLDKAAFLHRSNSAPIMHFFKPDYQVSALHTTKSPSTTMDQGLRKQHQARTSSSPSRVEFGRSVSASSDHYGGYNDETNARLRAVEAALLDLKQHQYDSQKFSAFTKIMIGMGLLNAVGAGASAELSVQNAIEAAKKNYSQQNKLPDVTNLDPTTCTKFQTEVTGLDCSKAHGVKFA